MAKTSRALSKFRIDGVATNIPFVRAVLVHEDVVAGRVHTHVCLARTLLRKLDRVVFVLCDQIDNTLGTWKERDPASSGVCMPPPPPSIIAGPPIAMVVPSVAMMTSPQGHRRTVPGEGAAVDDGNERDEGRSAAGTA